MAVGSSKSGRVLLIDDDEMVSVALFEHLLNHGIEVSQAADTRTAAVALRKHAFDVVVVDTYLTGQHEETAFSLMQTIDELQPLAHKIVLTAYDSPETLRSFGQDAVTFMIKPQPIARVYDLIASLLPR